MNMQVDTHIWHIIPSVLRRNINLETAPKLSLSFWNSNFDIQRNRTNILTRAIRYQISTTMPQVAE